MICSRFRIEQVTLLQLRNDMDISFTYKVTFPVQQCRRFKILVTEEYRFYGTVEKPALTSMGGTLEIG